MPCNYRTTYPRATALSLVALFWLSGGAHASNTSDWFELDLREDLSQWTLSIGLPPDQSDPLDRPGTLGVPNLLAYAMGLNPLEATPAELPRLVPSEMLVLGPQAAATERERNDELLFLYRKNRDAVNVEFWLEVSKSLERWERFDPAEERVLFEENGVEMRAVIVDPGETDKLFLRARAIQTD